MGCSLIDYVPKVIDITNEVIRDYWSEVNATEDVDQHFSDNSITNRHRDYSSDSGNRSTFHHHRNGDFNTSNRNRMASRLRDPGNIMPVPMEISGSAMTSGFAEPNGDSPASLHTPHSYDLVQLAAVQLLDLGAGPTSAMSPMIDVRTPQTHLGNQQLPPLVHVESDIPEAAGISPEQLFADDGIFLPGSAYLELHSALRNHIFDTARSTYPSRWPTPTLAEGNVDEVPEVRTQQISHIAPDAGGSQTEQTAQSSDTTPRLIELTNQEEYVLWKNWVDEIAPWVR